MTLGIVERSISATLPCSTMTKGKISQVGSRSASHPSRWPDSVEYTTIYRYACSISSEALSHIQGNGSRDSSHGTATPLLATIRVIDNPLHPAFGQRGLFAAKKIPPRVHILDYLGEVHDDERPESDYDLSLYRSQDGTINVGVCEIQTLRAPARSMVNRDVCIDRRIEDWQRGTIHQ